MTIKVYSYNENGILIGTTTENDVQIIYFEDQRDVNNGLWLHIGKKHGRSLSIEFDPDHDTFMIYE